MAKRSEGSFQFSVASGQFPGGKWLLKGLHYIAEKAAQVVALRVDMHLAGSLFIMFRLQRIELNEVKGCLELA